MWFEMIFSGSLAVFNKERGEPACGRATPEGEPSVPYGAGKIRMALFRRFRRRNAFELFSI
jgi:hypothetical protein